MKKWICSIIIVLIIFCSHWLYANNGLRFAEIEDINRCFVTLDVRDRKHKTIIPMDNGEFIKVSKDVYLPDNARRFTTNIILEYKDSKAVIPNVNGDILTFDRLKTNDDSALFWYGSAYLLGNCGRFNKIYIIGIHDNKIKLLMDDRDLYELGYNGGKLSSANDLFIAKDGSLVLNPFKSTNDMSNNQAKLIWNGNNFDIVIGNYSKELTINSEKSSWPYYKL